MFLGERLSKIKPSKQFVFVQALPPERVGESFEERTEYALHASAMHNSTIVSGELKGVFWEKGALAAPDPGIEG